MSNIISFVREEKKMWHWAYKAIREQKWLEMELPELEKLAELKRRYDQELPRLPELLASHADYLSNEYRKNMGWPVRDKGEEICSFPKWNRVQSAL